MKGKNLLQTVITCIFILYLTGCGHEHVWQESTCLTPKACSECGETEGEPTGHQWIEATCEEKRHCEICGETEGEPLEHEWVEATYTSPMTCTLCGKTEGGPLAEPYGEKNNIVFEDMEDMEMPFAMSFSKDGELVDIDGMTLETGMAKYSFGDITSKPSEQAGCIDIVVPFTINLPAVFYMDSRLSDGSCSWNYTYASFGVGDFYTGIEVPARSSYDDETLEFSKDYEWNGNTYSICYSINTDIDAYKSDWEMVDEYMWCMNYEYTINRVYTITIPEGYDGLVLKIRRNGRTEVSLAGATEETKKISNTESYLLDTSKPEDYIFYRISDIL